MSSTTKQLPQISLSEAAEKFKAALQAAGLTPPDVIEPGKLHRFPTNGKRGDDAGWCKLFPDMRGGVFGDHRSGLSEHWSIKADPAMTTVERQAFRRQVAESKRQAEAEERKRHEAAARKAVAILETATGDPATHPYVIKKKSVPLEPWIKRGAWAQRDWPDALLIPIYRADGNIWSIEAINPDGKKDFLAGSKTGGEFHPFGEIRDAPKLLIGEGVATVAACVDATGLPAAAALSAGNLEATTQAVRKLAPDAVIIILADNDVKSNGGNPGMTAAMDEARAAGGRVAVPELNGRKCDLWDLWAEFGSEAVRYVLNNAKDPEKALDGSPPAPDETAIGTDAEAITRLAALPPLEYSRDRKGEAERLGVRVTDLDAEVKRAREGARVDLSAAVPAGKGQGLNVAKADPWPDSIDLNEVLNELVTEINRYAVLSTHADTAIVLWIAHTYVYDAGDISPFLFLTSPEKRCGKSTVLIFLLGLVNRPMVASNISPSSIFRVIEACRPTLLIDEADTFFNENEALRGVMNSGHTKPLAYVIRTVDIGGGVFEPRQFSTWAPKAVAGIKRLADTLEDRSIIVELKRKLPGEHTLRIAKFNGDTIRRKLTRWARDNFGAIKDADPQLPAGVYNRLADNWLPLLAIAELAGAEWSGRATKALLAGMDNDSRTDSAGVILLSDLKALFKEKNNPESLATREILDRLHEMDDRSWPAWGRL